MLKETGSLFNKANQGKVGDKKYLIGASWWQQWCDYVNFDAIASCIGRVENLEFKLNNDLMYEKEAPAYFSMPRKTAPQKKEIERDASEELIPSESARLRLSDFRAEL